MNTPLTLLAAAEHGAEGGDTFSALGIDLQMLIFQSIAFLILVWIMAKWVFPPLLKAVDERQKKIEESTKAATEAEKKAAEAEAKIEAVLKQARTEATDIVATAKTEAINMVEKAQSDAKVRSERIVAEAEEDIAKNVLKARQALEKDTLNLVKKAASLATLSAADSKLDGAMIRKSVEEAKR